MAEKASTEHNDNAAAAHADHEAALAGAVALANLFSNCVEAFNLITAGQKWQRDEQLLLCRLGLQQARLLIWGSVVGVSSPPGSVTDRAVPKHPSAAYPDLKEPTFFGHRDERLDDPEIRKQVEDALATIVDRSSHASREEMMEKYGLKPPKRFENSHQPALDLNRLESFREQYELLQEVAESYAQISARRNASITRTSWVVADVGKFSSFITLTTEKIDFLISLLDVKERVDRGMIMDIKALGWHLSADRSRVAMDVSKLRLINEICKDEYPEYLSAVKIALDNIEKEKRENLLNYNPYAAMPLESAQPSATERRGSTPMVQTPHAHANGQGHHGGKGEEHHHKRPGLFGLFRSFNKKDKAKHPAINAGRSQSVSAASSTGQSASDDPPRALSDAGPITQPSDDLDLEPVRSKSVGALMETPTEQIRSKSVGDILDVRPETEEEEQLVKKLTLQRLDTQQTVKDEEGVGGDGGALDGKISRHDQYHGLGRQGTKTQW